jgi:hypothetical protein
MLWALQRDGLSTLPLHEEYARPALHNRPSRPAPDAQDERKIDGMNVEILHIDECPSWERAEARTREALTALGRTDILVTTRLLRTPEEAAGTPFAGSPTITIDGVDVFPSDGRTSDLACRVYATPDGLKGTPTTEQITDALRQRI